MLASWTSSRVFHAQDWWCQTGICLGNLWPFSCISVRHEPKIVQKRKVPKLSNLSFVWGPLRAKNELQRKVMIFKNAYSRCIIYEMYLRKSFATANSQVFCDEDWRVQSKNSKIMTIEKVGAKWLAGAQNVKFLKSLQGFPEKVPGFI